jgi:uncharacterized membrane protein YhaH (DUF805 family)
MNRLRRYKYILYACLKLPECIKSMKAHHNWSFACAIWVFPVCQLLGAIVYTSRRLHSFTESGIIQYSLIILTIHLNYNKLSSQYILIIHMNRLRRYIYILYACLKLPECIKSIESVSQLVACLRYLGFSRMSTAGCNRIHFPQVALVYRKRYNTIPR